MSRSYGRPEWLAVALPALLTDRSTGESSTVGIAVDGEVLQVQASRSGVQVSPHDGGELDAVVRADAAVVLGMAAGALPFDDALGLAEGDEAAVRAVFGAAPQAKGKEQTLPATSNI